MQKIKKVHLRVNGLLLTVIDINNLHHVNKTVAPINNEIDFNWASEDNDILQKAISTIGINWEIIAKDWFNGLKSANYLANQWKILCLLQTSNDTRTNVHTISSSLLSTTQPTLTLKHCNNTHSKEKPISGRRRKELESLETKKLFGKQLSEEEIILVHRAYFIGQNMIDKILRMNNTQEIKDGNNISVSFDSLIVEIQRVPRDKVLASRTSMSRWLQNLPCTIGKRRDEKVISSSKYSIKNRILDYIPNKDNIMNITCFAEIPMNEVFAMYQLRLISSIKHNNEAQQETIVPSKCDIDKRLNEYTSPQLNIPFPYLPNQEMTLF